MSFGGNVLEDAENLDLAEGIEENGRGLVDDVLQGAGSDGARLLAGSSLLVEDAGVHVDDVPLRPGLDLLEQGSSVGRRITGSVGLGGWARWVRRGRRGRRRGGGGGRLVGGGGGVELGVEEVGSRRSEGESRRDCCRSVCECELGRAEIADDLPRRDELVVRSEFGVRSPVGHVKRGRSLRVNHAAFEEARCFVVALSQLSLQLALEADDLPNLHHRARDLLVARHAHPNGSLVLAVSSSAASSPRRVPRVVATALRRRREVGDTLAKCSLLRSVVRVRLLELFAGLDEHLLRGSVLSHVESCCVRGVLCCSSFLAR